MFLQCMALAIQDRKLMELCFANVKRKNISWGVVAEIAWARLATVGHACKQERC
jgi:hypothetical protein